MLSGKAPGEHGAICNLRSLERVDKLNLISTELQNEGYRTVYAIDERRFNNIDETFGFDRLVGPEAGGLDFIIQRLNDTPISNLLLQTGLGRIFMPYSYINTASYPNYDAEAFVDLVLDATDGAEKLFLATHFESAHFPFKTRHSKHDFSSGNQFWNHHAAALTAVDEQVGRLVEGLTQQGFLQNALVIVLSDHGEGLGELEATITMNGKPEQIIGYGHGGNILSDHQNRIVLGVVHYENGKPVQQVKHSSEQVSLTDIRALILSYRQTDSSEIKPKQACMTVETGIRFDAIADYRTLDEASLAASSASFYEIDSDGRMRLREDHLQQLVDGKDIGWRCADHLTWWDATQDQYFSMGMDENGNFTTEQPPPTGDINKIEAYRAQLLANVRR